MKVKFLWGYKILECFDGDISNLEDFNGYIRN